MRPLAEYGAVDWLRLRPVLQAYKTVRYDTLDYLYSKRMAHPDRAAERLLAGGSLASLVVTIAFDNPWVIERQARLSKRNLTDSAYVVADNSNSPSAAQAIAATCQRLAVPYVRLPPNPSRSPSRSHGLALNWAYRNIVKAVEPEVFAFIDHDLLPLRPVRLREKVAWQPLYGPIVLRGRRWYLWPGYCVFRFDCVRAFGLDFRQDWFNGLDTGGANWRRLYRHILRRDLRLTTHEFQTIHDAQSQPVGRIEYIDEWLHIGQASGWAPVSDAMWPAVDGVIARHVGADGGEHRRPSQG